MSEVISAEKLELNETQRAESQQAEATATITVINDTDTPVLATLGNGFLGFASMGFIEPGGRLELPCSPALWDVYVLFAGETEIAMRWYGTCVPEVYYNRKQGNVGIGSKVHVSDLNPA